MSTIDHYQVIQRIRSALADIGWHAASERWGVTTIHLAAVLSSRRDPSKKLLTALKLRKIVMYEEIP